VNAGRRDRADPRTGLEAGFELKARDARLFLPPGLCTRCDVVEESATHFVREATIAGAELREIITLEPQRKVTFFQATGPREGAIINELVRGRGRRSAASVLLLSSACAAKRT
jgi:hypothetical protein